MCPQCTWRAVIHASRPGPPRGQALGQLHRPCPTLTRVHTHCLLALTPSKQDSAQSVGERAGSALAPSTPGPPAGEAGAGRAKAWTRPRYGRQAGGPREPAAPSRARLEQLKAQLFPEQRPEGS